MNNQIDDGEKTTAFCFEEQTETIHLYKFGGNTEQYKREP